MPIMSIPRCAFGPCPGRRRDQANLEAAEDAVTVTTANRGTSGLPLGSIACRSSLTGVYTKVGSFTAQPGCIPLDPFGIGNASHQAIAYVTDNKDFEDQGLEQDVLEGSMQGTLPWQLPAGPVAIAFGAGYRKEAGRNVGTNWAPRPPLPRPTTPTSPASTM